MFVWHAELCETNKHDPLNFKSAEVLDTCNSFKRYRNPEKISSIESALRRPTNYLNLHVYPSREGSKTFLLCAFAKTGCSQWILLLNYLMFGEKKKMASRDIYQARKASVFDVTNASHLHFLRSNVVPRILIMRNPYNRVASSYADFIRRAQRAGNANQSSISFTTFVETYVEKREIAIQPMDHRQPISEGCHIWHNESPLMEWDYVLRLEEMVLWSNCLFNELNLTHIIDKGWGKNGTVPLFNRTTSMLVLHVNDVLPSILGRQPWPSQKTFETGHERVKSSHESFFTPHTIEIINRVFERDFQIGQYALWDGSENFPLQ